MSFNLSGTLNCLRLLYSPALCIPHSSIRSFNELPIPLSKAFVNGVGGSEPDIRAVVLDKDNCFARTNQNEVFSLYRTKFQHLREAYPGRRLLIVSNTAGTRSDPALADAALLERNTGVKVLQHSTKKPGCHAEVMEYFRAHPDSGVTSPAQIAVVGDRLFTDVMLANMMGSYSVWLKDGVDGAVSPFAKLEQKFAALLKYANYRPPPPLNAPSERWKHNEK